MTTLARSAPNSAPSFAPAVSSLVKRYRVSWTFVDKVLGGIPKSPDVIQAWVEAVVKDKARTHSIIEESRKAIPVVEDEAIEETIKDMGWTTFKVDAEKGLYVESRQVKALLKEAANILKGVLKVTAFKARVAERVFVEGSRIYLDRTAPDGYLERPIHVFTPAGPRDSLKRSDYVEGASLSFTLLVLDEPMVTSGPKPKKGEKAKKSYKPEEYLRHLFEYGQLLGFGADRSQGFGQYALTALAPLDHDYA